jgi:hypothetical protein
LRKREREKKEGGYIKKRREMLKKGESNLNAIASYFMEA